MRDRGKAILTMAKATSIPFLIPLPLKRCSDLFKGNGPMAFFMEKE